MRWDNFDPQRFVKRYKIMTFMWWPRRLTVQLQCLTQFTWNFWPSSVVINYFWNSSVLNFYHSVVIFDRVQLRFLTQISCAWYLTQFNCDFLITELRKLIIELWKITTELWAFWAITHLSSLVFSFSIAFNYNKYFSYLSRLAHTSPRKSKCMVSHIH